MTTPFLRAQKAVHTWLQAHPRLMSDEARQDLIAEVHLAIAQHGEDVRREGSAPPAGEPEDPLRRVAEERAAFQRDEEDRLP
jgi:hypothetical protein